MKIMKQIASRISIYSADAFGVCSALYELGGLCVMHDASGCNSTYNTHDEPRWYDFDSMVYISGLSEMEAIMGDDQKFIDDIVYTAKELSPNFIAMAGTPIPTMIGTDFKAIANIIEKETNIPTFGFDTTGMHSYVSGAYKAFEALAKRFLKRNDKESRGEQKESVDKESREAKNTIIKVNILGATPLDFSINKSIEAMVDLLKENNFEVISTWAMGSSLEYIKNAGDADVNLVVSYSGMGAAKYMYENLNIPYVVGTPFGKEFANKVIEDLKEVKSTKENKISYDKNIQTKKINLVSLYQDILNTKNELEYRKKAYEHYRVDLDKLKKSYELGASPKINLESVELEAEDSKLQIDILETKLKSLYDVGKTDYNIDFENYKLLDFVENNESIDFILNSYMKDEVEELRLSLSMAEERKSYSNYDRYMPDLYLGYERVDRNLRGDRYYRDQDLFTIKFSKKLFSTDSEYKLNELEVENLKNDLNEKIRVINAEKIKLKSEYHELLKLASIGDKKSNIAYKKYLIKEKEYELNKSSYLDVIDEYNKYLSQEIETKKAKNALNAFVYKIKIKR